MENAREIVLDALLQTEREKEFSSSLIADILNKYDYLDRREKALIKRLYEGTIERQISLDYYLNKVSSVRTGKMKPLIRVLLRMGSYQLLYTEIPDHAVVSETVSLVKKKGKGKLSGFVNGVLRGMIRLRDGEGGLPLPEGGDLTERLEVQYSIPRWIPALWVERYGEEKAEAILKAMENPREVSLRFSAGMVEEECERLLQSILDGGVTLRQSGVDPSVYLAGHLEGISHLPGYEEGAFTVQDLSSVLAVKALRLQKGEHVLDCCAAPGGKSLLAAELVGEEGHVLSRDLTERKVSRIQENALRCHCRNLETQVQDALEETPELREGMDALILDLPCSGLGILGKKRDIKYRVQEEDLKELAELQREILQTCHVYVKPGGRMLYSTCTIDPAENEEQAAWIEQQLPFRMLEQRQFLPDEGEWDGFYYAVFQRI